MNNGATISFENFYDKYCDMIYGIALEISPNKKIAEEILMSTFCKSHKLEIYLKDDPSHRMDLMQLAINVAREKLQESGDNSLTKLKQFESAILAHLGKNSKHISHLRPSAFNRQNRKSE